MLTLFAQHSLWWCAFRCIAFDRPGTAAADAVSALATKVGSTTDAVCIAAAMQQPFNPLVLSGAVTPHQIRENAGALQLTLAAEDLAGVMKACVMEPAEYWKERSALAWN